jgi:hypothetical protein
MRPSSISGKPVRSEMSRTERPASRRARAVPPVDTSSTPRPESCFANGTRPVLSVTLRSARRTCLLLLKKMLLEWEETQAGFWIDSQKLYSRWNGLSCFRTASSKFTKTDIG